MAIIKTQNNRRNAANTGWDVIHQETSADIVLMDDGVTTVEGKILEAEKTVINENRTLSMGGMV